VSWTELIPGLIVAKCFYHADQAGMSRMGHTARMWHENATL